MSNLDSGKKEPEDKSTELLGEYRSLIATHNDLTARMVAISGRELGAGDPKASERIEEIDRERHATHLRLLEIGKIIDKDESTVLVDLIREQRTLEGYQLPEFSILTGNDILATGNWHRPLYFNVDTNNNLPRKAGEGDKMAEYLRGDYDETMSEDFYEDNEIKGLKKSKSEVLEIIPKDEFMLVYAVSPITNYGETCARPEDYEIRFQRAEALAKKMKGKMFIRSDSGYHVASAELTGVLFKTKDFEEIINVIRNSQEEYRIGEEFYSEEEKESLRRIRQEKVDLENEYADYNANEEESYKKSVVEKTLEILSEQFEYALNDNRLNEAGQILTEIREIRKQQKNS